MNAVVVGVISFFVGISIGIGVVSIVDLQFVSLEKRQWNCTQSKIVDQNNVDKVECVVYKRVEKDAISQ